MAAQGRRPPASVADELFRAPRRFGFFQAVRLLEQAARLQARQGRMRGPDLVGEDADPQREPVRFRAHPSLRFPPAEIAAMRAAEPPPAPGGGARPPEMQISLMGLTGPTGVLPQHYTELLIRNIRARNFALREFLGLFEHRAASLFYRAWAKYRLPILYERDEGRGDDPATGALFALIGLATPHLRGRLAVDDQTPLFYAGFFAHAPRSAAALEAMLGDYFARPVLVEQFQGHWLRLPPDERSRLAGATSPESSYGRLGRDAVLGERVWDVQSRFRLRIGPLSYAEFRRFMPSPADVDRRLAGNGAADRPPPPDHAGGSDLKRLADLVRLFVGPALGFDVQLTLRREEAPPVRLSADEGYVPRLGWNTWLVDRPLFQDVSDAVFLNR